MQVTGQSAGYLHNEAVLLSIILELGTLGHILVTVSYSLAILIIKLQNS